MIVFLKYALIINIIKKNKIYLDITEIYNNISDYILSMDIKELKNGI